VFQAPPDPVDHWPTSDTTQHVTPGGGWADTIPELLNGIPGWVWAAAVAALLATMMVTLPVARRLARKAGARSAGKLSPTDRRDQILLGAALIPTTLFGTAVLVGSARGLITFGRDTLRWVDGWEYLVPATLDGIAISFGVLAFRAVRKERNPDRATRIAWAAMFASAIINFFHEAGSAYGSVLGGGYLGLMSLFGMLIFHEFLAQFEDGADAAVRRDNPKFGMRWLTWPTNTACAWVAWRNYPPAEGTRATIAAAITHLDQVRADKRRRRVQQLATEIATPRWTVVWPWARITQLSAAVAEYRADAGRSVRADVEPTDHGQPTTAPDHRADQRQPATTDHTDRQARSSTDHRPTTGRTRPTGRPTSSRPATDRTSADRSTNVQPLWSAAAVANAASLRERFGDQLPTTDRQARDAMGWSHDRTVAAIRAYRAGADQRIGADRPTDQTRPTSELVDEGTPTDRAATA